MNTERWHIAARLWADARNRGRPTADSKSLDIDVLVAATALSLQSEDDVLVVTTNIRHLAQFVDARLWSEISFGQG
jgi:predicted nucleic acid-binding protein